MKVCILWTWERQVNANNIACFASFYPSINAFRVAPLGTFNWQIKKYFKILIIYLAVSVAQIWKY